MLVHAYSISSQNVSVLLAISRVMAIAIAMGMDMGIAMATLDRAPLTGPTLSSYPVQKK